MNSDIHVSRAFPIVAGFVQVPPNREGDKTRWSVDDFLAAVPGSQVVRLPPLTGPNTGSKFGDQEFVEVPGQTFALPG